MKTIKLYKKHSTSLVEERKIILYGLFSFTFVVWFLENLVYSTKPMNITSFNKITINKIVVWINDCVHNYFMILTMLKNLNLAEWLFRQEELEGIGIDRKTTSLPFYANGQNHFNLLDLNRICILYLLGIAAATRFRFWILTST